MNRNLNLFIVSILILSIFSSCSKTDSDIKLLDKANFDTEIDGKKVSLYTLDSGNGLIMQVTNYGGRIVSLWVPDKNNKHEDVVLGFESINKYINNEGERFLGPVIGRYGNRIANGKFELDSITYQLPQNDGTNTLHGGVEGFDSRVWDVDSVTENSIVLSYISPDGEEGFPGTVNVKMTYELSKNNELIIKYEANTDKPTHINLTNHSHFNLKGAGNGTVEDHLLTINASNITPVDSILIPTGEFMEVENTPFDFRNSTLIGERINNENDQLTKGKGYDHNWVIDKNTTGVELIATLYEPTSGRVMEVLTDQPGVQIYTGNFFTGEVIGKYEKPLLQRGAIAMEVQKYPNTPNQENFPTTRVNPEDTYTQTCIYKFSNK